MKKYIPKYFPTRYEGYDSDELSHLLLNLNLKFKRDKRNQWLVRMIPFAIALGIILYFIVR